MILLEEFTKFDVLRIISDHFDSYRHAGTKRLQWGLITSVFIVPLIAGIICGFFALKLSSLAEILGNVYSIFCGLLFNLLVLMKNEYKAAKESQIQSEQQLVNEAYANISFCILISLLGLLSLTFGAIPVCSVSPLDTVSLLCNGKFYLPNVFIVFLFVVFIFNLVLVIKRIYEICRPE